MAGVARIIDVSVPLGPDLPVWPGDPPVEIRPVSSVESDGVAVSEIRMSSHAGTHLDAPAHFVAGAATVDQLPLDALVGPATVVDAAAGLADIPDGCDRLLLRTGGRGGLTPADAGRLIDAGVRLVAIDAPSVEPSMASEDLAGHPVHRALLEAGVVIVEGLDLTEAAPGEYTLLCLPLRIAGGDGAPARVLLVEG